MIKKWKNDVFYSQIFRLLLPIVLQNLLSAAVSSADVVMLNYVGQSSISAVSLASQYASVLFMVYYGLGTGATILCAQYFGKGDMRAIEIVEGIALRFSMLISIVIAAFALTAPELMMTLFTNDPELILIGSDQYRAEHHGFYFKYSFECRIYFRSFRCSQNGSPRRCAGNLHLPRD